MIYKYVSAKAVLAKLYRDLNLTTEINEGHVLEWIGEVLSVIGSYAQYEKQHIQLELTNGRVQLPANFDKLVYISYNNKPLAWSDNTHIHKFDECSIGIPKCCTDYYFYIEGNTIITDIKETNNKYKLNIEYLGIVTDNEGYPMIPDDVYFMKACASYVTYMLDYREWRKGNIPDKVMQKSESEYLFYVNSARGSANMPNIHQIESLKNEWVRLIPSNNQFKNLFNNVGEQERRFKH